MINHTVKNRGCVRRISFLRRHNESVHYLSILASPVDENDYLDFESTYQESTASAHELTVGDEDQDV